MYEEYAKRKSSMMYFLQENTTQLCIFYLLRDTESFVVNTRVLHITSCFASCSFLLHKIDICMYKYFREHHSLWRRLLQKNISILASFLLLPLPCLCYYYVEDIRHSLSLIYACVLRGFYFLLKMKCKITNKFWWFIIWKYIKTLKI